MDSKLKIYLSALIFLVASTSASADNDWRSRCKSISELAETIMESRQSGVSMARIVGSDKGAMRDMMESLAIDAFEHRRYSTERMKREATLDFRDKIYLECFMEMKASAARKK